MNIEYKIGDITQASEDIIAHGCNCHGVMGSGVALCIKNVFPEAFTEYQKQYFDKHDDSQVKHWPEQCQNCSEQDYKKSHDFNLGNIIYVYTKNKIIANCLTQEDYGRKDRRYMSYDAVNDCMAKLNQFAKEKGLTVALPLIGARLGGGKWKIISSIIETNFKDVKPVVYILNKEELNNID